MNTNNFYNEVYSWLEAGHDMTTIAKHITEAMNKAQADHNAKKQAALAKERKMAQVAKIYDLVQAYMKEHAPDLEQTPDTNREEAVAQVYEGLEEFIALMREAIKEIGDTTPPTVKNSNDVTAIDPQRSISNFLREMGLL
jgi:hypothetical protein